MCSFIINRIFSVRQAPSNFDFFPNFQSKVPANCSQKNDDFSYLSKRHVLIESNLF